MCSTQTKLAFANPALHEFGPNSGHIPEYSGLLERTSLDQTDDDGYRPTLGISGGAKHRPSHAVVTPLLIQGMTRCARGRSCLSRLPFRATRARLLPRQEEIAAR